MFIARRARLKPPVPAPSPYSPPPSLSAVPSRRRRCVHHTSTLRHQSALHRSHSPSHTQPPIPKITTWCPLPHLPSPSLPTFRAEAFTPKLPHHLPRTFSLPATHKWFHHPDETPTLNTPYLAPHASVLLPMELTSPDEPPIFHRASAPLSFFLNYASLAASASIPRSTSPPNPQTKSQDTRDGRQASFYISQSPLSLLPAPLRADFPIPSLVTDAGRGDVYTDSLWMGLAPTSTPLHRDPNPNLLVQVAGSKVVRLLAPEVGDALGDLLGLGKVRGEEMMVGERRGVVQGWVWGEDWDGSGGMGERMGGGAEGEEKGKEKGMGERGWEVRLEPGDGVFIPEGWWHAVRGVGRGVNCSVSRRRHLRGCGDRTDAPWRRSIGGSAELAF
ncbi:hypothetical protein MMC10_004902 [Thelotrema lepadinum]|nr:hypothetical protein [Thelotrema lepadinum]